MNVGLKRTDADDCTLCRSDYIFLVILSNLCHKYNYFQAPMCSCQQKQAISFTLYLGSMDELLALWGQRELIINLLNH